MAVVGGVGAILITNSYQPTADTASTPHPPMDSGLERPQTAVPFTLPDKAGQQQSLAQFAGRPIVLNFWASWCPPCLDEMPSLQKLVNALADTDLAVVTVTLDESWEDVDKVLTKTGFGEGALVLMDADRAVASSYGTVKVPETFIIDREGRVVHFYMGAKDWGSEAFIKDVRQLVEHQPTAH